MTGNPYFKKRLSPTILVGIKKEQTTNICNMDEFQKHIVCKRVRNILFHLFEVLEEAQLSTVEKNQNFWDWTGNQN